MGTFIRFFSAACVMLSTPAYASKSSYTDNCLNLTLTRTHILVEVDVLNAKCGVPIDDAEVICSARNTVYGYTVGGVASLCVEVRRPWQYVISCRAHAAGYKSSRWQKVRPPSKPRKQHLYIYLMPDHAYRCATDSTSR